MKSLLSALILTLSITSVSQAQTANTDGCMKTIGANENWGPLGSDQVTCVSSQADFASISQILCEQGNSEISSKYKDYLDLGAHIKIAYADWEKACEGTNAAQRSATFQKYDQLQRQQIRFASENKIDRAIQAVDHDRSVCE